MILNGYNIHGELKSENSGFSKWGFGTKNGRTYFIKEFLAPIYPMPGASDGLSEYQIKKRVQACEDFEARMYAIVKAVNGASDGNLVRIREFFRHDSKYYVVTDKVESTGLSVREIAMLPIPTKKFICKLIAHSMSYLHNECFIHADIKPTNILVNLNQDKCTTKVIDFDCGFFGTNPPSFEDELHGDPVYFAPEALMFMAEEEVALSCKMDVFALGILFHQYMTGVQPLFDTSSFSYVAEAKLCGGEVKIHPDVPADFAEILEKMLCKDPEERISIQEVYDSIKF